ncbi:hypothetical protein Tco_0514536, partial [Tanacetum coccineum]
FREYDLAHLKLVFEFSIYTVWKSVRYGVSNGLDTVYWVFLEYGPCLISSRILYYYISNTAYWSSLDTAYYSCFLRGLWCGHQFCYGCGKYHPDHRWHKCPDAKIPY